MSGVSEMYQRRGRGDVNMVAVAGDGATADCGFQSLSGAAERGTKMLYVCYDNEGYMNTGFQRSCTTSRGSRTCTTPAGEAINGKEQGAKYVPADTGHARHRVLRHGEPEPYDGLRRQGKARPRVLQARLRLPARLLALPDGLGLQARTRA